jgi:hypothetical protein
MSSRIAMALMLCLRCLPAGTLGAMANMVFILHASFLAIVPL